MKKIITLTAFSFLLFSGCGNKGEENPVATGTDFIIEHSGRETVRVECPGSNGCGLLNQKLAGKGTQTVCKEWHGLPPDAVVSNKDKCTKIVKHIKIFPPVLEKKLPENQACTMIYGGPETIKVEGVINDAQVDFERTRADGCEIYQYDIWDGIAKAS